MLTLTKMLGWKLSITGPQAGGGRFHYCDVIMGAIAYQITGPTIVYSTVYSDLRKHQISASLAFLRGIHRWPANSPHEWPVTRKMFSFDDVIMLINLSPSVTPWVVVTTTCGATGGGRAVGPGMFCFRWWPYWICCTCMCILYREAIKTLFILSIYLTFANYLMIDRYYLIMLRYLGLHSLTD